MTPKYLIGDVAYHVSVNWTTKQQPCPDCFGHRRWSAILPAGEEILIECPTCWAGYEGSRGTVDDWDFHYHIDECEIAGLTKNAGGFEYVAESLGHSSRWHVVESQLHASHDDAKAFGEAEVIRVAKEKRTQQARQFADRRKDKAAGMTAYYRREIREAKKRIASAEAGLAEINTQPAQEPPCPSPS